MNKILAAFAVAFGALCIGLAVYYWLTPAGALFQLLPGYEAGSSVVHVKHGLASLALGVVLCIYAWFVSAA